MKMRGIVMEYLSIRQTAEKWGITARQVQAYIHSERVPGAVKIGEYWAVPKDSEKPIRKKKQKKMVKA